MTIAIYLRGTAASRARQAVECEAFAAVHYPGAPVAVYDDGEGHGRRPALTRLCADMEAGRLAAVITAEMIRLVRPPELMYELGPCAALLHDVREGGDIDLATADGRLTARMYAAAVAIRDAGGDS
jgi:DNA invertase Pin-like site-specific DNA recombinase